MLTLLSVIDYKKLIGPLVGLLIVIGIFLYIKHLKSEITHRDGIITALQSDYAKDKFIWEVNEKTLTDSIEDQNNKIELMKIDEAKQLKIFNKKLDNVKNNYIVKIDHVKDSNSSYKKECDTLIRIIDEELK